MPNGSSEDIDGNWRFLNHKTESLPPKLLLMQILRKPYCSDMRAASILGLGLAAGCGLSLPPVEPLGPEVDQADRTAQILADSYVSWVWSAYPAEGTAAGIHDLDHTYGDWSPKAWRGRLETLRYYLAEIDWALRGRLSKARRFDLDALRMDIELRILRGPPPNWVAMGLLSLLGSSSVADPDRGRWLAARLHEIPSIGERRGDPDLLLAAIAAAEAWFRSSGDDDLKSAGLRAAKVARAAVAKDPPPSPLGEDRLRALLSILQQGRPDRHVDLRAIAATARERLAALPRRPHARVLPSRPQVILEDNPWGIPGILVGPELFADGMVFARYRALGVGFEEAAEVYPGRLTHRAYLRERASPAAKLARNVMLEQGHVLLAAQSTGHLHAEAIAIWRLLAAIEYHAGWVDAAAAMRILREGGGIAEDDARREMVALATDPESATGPLGAWYLELLLERASWESILSMGHAPLDALWGALVGGPAPREPFLGRERRNY